MKIKNNNFQSSIQLPKCRATFYSLLASLVALQAYSSVISAKEESLEKDKKVVVTGTRIKKVDINNLSPILSISRDDIDKMGFATVKDVVDGATQNTGGTIDNSLTFGFTPGASSVNLRGIGFGHTLVLIDGRRMPIYPIGIGGTRNFVDLSSIPVAFVERIDVLTDGASAVYGSDAVSGVINVITRKEIEGINLSYRFGDSTGGGYKNHRFNLLTGARNGDTQIDLILDYWTQQAVWANQRSYAASDTANSRGSYSAGGSSFYGLETETVYQDPNCGTAGDALGGLGIPDVEVGLFNQGESWCGYDRSVHRQLIAPQDRVSLMTRLSYEITTDLSFFSRVGYSKSSTKTQFEPNFYGGSLFNDAANPAVANNGAILPAGADNNPTTGTAFEESGVFIRRLVEFGPRQSDVNNNSYNFLSGLKGNFGQGQYDWEFGFAYNKTALDIDTNNILLSGLHAAVDNGLDLFEPIPEQTVASLSYNANRNSYSTNRVVDFSVSGDLNLSFDAGPIQFALAAEQVSEEYSDQPNNFVKQGDAFDGNSSGAGKRKHIGIGGELSFPFSDNFEMDIALRWDDYDDASSVDSAFSPRIAMGYRPFENWLTRLSWGKSFRAPDMQRLFGGETKGFSGILDPAFLIDADGNTCVTVDDSPSCSPLFVESVQIFTLSNIDLKEEKGSNLNLGIVWEAEKNISMSVDYFKITVDDVVQTFSPQSIVDICYFFVVDCDGVVERDVNGTLSSADAFVTTTAFNFAEQNTSGFDINLDYQWQDNLGSWTSKLSSTWVRSFETRLTDDFGTIDEISLGELPEFRHNLTLDWHNDAWGANVRVSYIDAMLGDFCTHCGKEDMISSWTTINLSGRFNYTDFTRVRAGINNLTDKQPPQDPTQTTWPWYANGAGYYSAVGREFYLQIETSL